MPESIVLSLIQLHRKNKFLIDILFLITVVTTLIQNMKVPAALLCS